MKKIMFFILATIALISFSSCINFFGPNNCQRPTMIRGRVIIQNQIPCNYHQQRRVIIRR